MRSTRANHTVEKMHEAVDASGEGEYSIDEHFKALFTAELGEEGYNEIESMARATVLMAHVASPDQSIKTAFMTFYYYITYKEPTNADH